jgi:two-component system, chemotaxis family, sensor kinase Cph1
MEHYWKQLAYARLDLSSCDSEPLQFCGAIQNCGWSLFCDPMTDVIVAASQNCEQLFSRTLGNIIGTKACEHLTLTDGKPCAIADHLNSPQLTMSELLVKESGANIFASCYRAGNLIGIDLEPRIGQADSRSLYFLERVRTVVRLLEMDYDNALPLDAAAAEFRTMTDYDRVMIYRFEPNGDVFVVAEAKIEGIESFKGLHYPASDIPPQARKIYEQSKYRMIADVDAEPVPVMVGAGLSRNTLDLGACAFRAVSPFHIQYLRNMGVRASFSVPINLNGKLWGLISCHQYRGPMTLSHNLRSACELTGQVISGRIHELMAIQQSKTQHQILAFSQSVLLSVTGGKTVLDAFKQQSTQLLAATASEGVYIRIGAEETSIGSVPPKEFVDSILTSLIHKKLTSVWESTCVAADLDITAHGAGIGALVVPLNVRLDDAIIWFRPEFPHNVKWGGSPHDKGTDDDELSPRRSFAIWSESVKGKSREWDTSDTDAAQTLFLTFVQDIFKKASELSRANVELARAAVAKDEFISLVSHELRTPLGAIVGWVDLLKDREIKDAEINRAIAVIDRNAKLQVSLIDDLLDISRITSGKIRINPKPEVSIGGVISEVANDLSPTATAKKIQILVDQPSDVVAEVDPERLRQVVWNLLTNAIKFTGTGGKVIVGLSDHGPLFEIYVLDNGIGIDAGHLKSIFDRFAQANDSDARKGGLGLGLSIVKALVELHGGEVIAESAGKGRGSKFIVTIPNLRATDVATKTTSASSPRQVLRGNHVLIAEDNPDTGLALLLTMQKLGADAELVRNGKLAYERLNHSHFDLLLSDLDMPDWDGYQLIRQWRIRETESRANAIPAIALTAYGTVQDSEKCRAAGFTGHLRKPASRAELLASLENLGLCKRES